MHTFILRLAAFSLFFGACGGGVGPDGRLVGGTCMHDRDCVRRCVSGDNNYPGGICTVSCSSQNDCPGGTYCVDDHGGICVPACFHPNDCVPFGRGFTCDDRNLRPSGEGLVCRVP